MSSENANKAPVFQLKASLYTLTTLHLLAADLMTLHEQLMKLRQQAPRFLNNTPIIIDLQRLPQDDTSVALDFVNLKTLLGQHELIVVGVRHVPPALIGAAKAAGFALLPNATSSKASGAHSTQLGAAKPLDPKDIKKGSELTKPATSKVEQIVAEEVTSHKAVQNTVVITKPVRSGQQIYAKDADLIVTGIVSPGAEIMADGNIHVYGVLRGRALAGAKGNTEARIFCQQLAPELISVAGNYWLIDDVLTRNKTNGAVQIYLKNDQLCLEPVGG